MTHIIEIVKIALNIGLIFLDIVGNLADIYAELMAKYKLDSASIAASAMAA